MNRIYLFIFFLLLIPVSVYGQCTASDNFTTSGVLGSPNWTQTTVTTTPANGFNGTPFAVGPLSTISSGSVAPANMTQGMVIWSNPSCVFPEDQTSSITISAGPMALSYTGPIVRGDPNGNGYAWLFTTSSAASGIYKLVNYNFSYQVAEYCPGPTPGHTYTIEARGNTIYGYVDGSSTPSCQGGDSAYTTGQPGFIADRSSYAGAWSSTTTYAINTAVSSGGELYTSIGGGLNIPVTDSSNWKDIGPLSSTLDVVSSFSAAFSTLLPPYFSYNTGIYGFSPVVILTNPNQASMCYTLDGTAPTATTPGTCSHGTLIANGGTVTVSSTSTITAITTRALSANSASTSQTYTIRSGAAQTWYVRPDGGTRNSSNVPNGQCDGLADVSYVSTGALTNARWAANTVYAPGAMVTDSNGFYETTTAGLTSGSAVIGPTWGSTSTSDGTGTWTKGAAYPKNNPCAFNDIRMFIQDGSNTDGTTFPGWGWIGAGGDTYIARGSIADGIAYSIGWNNLSTYCDATGCWGMSTGSRYSGIPSPYAGDPTHHTTFVGGNYSTSCTNQTDRTRLRGRWGTGSVFNLGYTSYIDTGCFDVTDYSNCGLDSDTVACRDDGENVISDFTFNGIQFDNDDHDVTMSHVRVHGAAGDGVNGAPGPNFTLTDFASIGNANSGMNLDNGTGRTGYGDLTITNFDISWNGCVEEYPLVDPKPYFSCTDASSGGYGDGFGTSTVQSIAPWHVHFDQGVASYNTQDGLDALHISGLNSTMVDTRVYAYGNEGQQLKVGGAAASIQNSVIVGNCEAMISGSQSPDVIYYYPQFAAYPRITGTPLGFGDLLQAPCRAGNTAVLISLTPGEPAVFQNNTLYESGAIGLEAEYATYDHGSTNTLNFDNNVFIGFDTEGDYSSIIFSSTDFKMFSNPGGSFLHNVIWNQRSNFPCPNTSIGDTTSICTDPGLVDETYHFNDFGNMGPTPDSPVLDTGVAVTGITLDIAGNTRPNPPSRGAYEIAPAMTTITVTPASGSVMIGKTVPFTAMCVYSDGSGGACTATWTGTNVHSSIGSVTGIVTGASVGTDTVTATVNSLFGTATVTITPLPPFVPMQGGMMFGVVTR